MGRCIIMWIFYEIVLGNDDSWLLRVSKYSDGRYIKAVILLALYYTSDCCHSALYNIIYLTLEWTALDELYLSQEVSGWLWLMTVYRGSLCVAVDDNQLNMMTTWGWKLRIPSGVHKIAWETRDHIFLSQ